MTQSLQNFRLLLVDEKTYVAQLEKESYKNKGVLAHVADNITDASRIIKKFSIDVVCANLDFKDGAGLAILKQLKQDYNDKVRLWTTSSVDIDEKQKELAYLENIDLFFVQPLSKDFFIKKIRTALNEPTRESQQRLTSPSLGSVRVKIQKSKQSKEPTYLKGQLMDLSNTGMRISYFEDLAIHHTYSFILTLDGISPLHLQGKVIRIHSQSSTPHTSHTSLGIEFVDMSQEHTDLLSAFLSTKHKKRNAASYYG
ncbi:MAG: PilZ domain-containing protein [Proteobacteria bacterium]|nr:PilZ domain-containing protein [Pseudomonadota bacterium]